MFGGFGFVRQKFVGEGIVFMQAGGTVLEKVLEAGEKITVDQESLVAMETSVKQGIRSFGGPAACCSICFGGEGCCLSVLTGPGKIWITSMNFHKWHRVMAPPLAGGGAAGGDGGDGGGE